MIAQATAYVAKALNVLRIAYMSDQSGDEGTATSLRSIVERTESLLCDENMSLLHFFGRCPLPPRLDREPQPAGVYTVEYLDGTQEQSWIYKTGPIGNMPEAFVTQELPEYGYNSPLGALMAMCAYRCVPPGGRYEEVH